MNSQEHNNSDKLKDFLNRKGAEDAAMDDFEKEAMEGFDTLANEEIMELKNSLDKRMQSEVIREKRSSSGRYWAAAAALLVIVGLTVFFMQVNTLSEEKDLAVHESEAIMETELKPAVQAPPAEPAVAESIESEAGAKSVQKQSFKVAEEDLNLIKDENHNGNRKAMAEEKTEAEHQPAPAAPPYVPENPNKYIAADRISDTVMTNQVLSSGAVLSRSHSEVLTAPANNANSPAKKDDVDFAYNESVEEEPVKKKEEIKSLEKEAKKTTAKPSKSKEVNADITAATAGLGVASYPGGEKALISDLKKLLEPKKLSKKFDGVLYINKDGKVQEMMITNAYDLKDSQRKEIIETVKQLGAFNCNDQPAQYHIQYRP